MIDDRRYYGNPSEYLAEHHISTVNHHNGNLLNSFRMKLVDVLRQMEVLDSIFSSNLKLIIPIFESFKSDCTS